MKILKHCILLLMLSSTLFPQSNQWVDFFTSAVIRTMITEGQNIWVCTEHGLIKMNSQTEQREFYYRGNSGLPGNTVYCMAIDSQGNKWIGTDNGLAKYNDTSWTVFNTSNSGLLDNSISHIAIDQSGNKWICHSTKGLVKYDGANWTVFTASNSGLPDNYLYSVAIDSKGNKWIAAGISIARFDDKSWTIYNSLNSGLPSGSIENMTIDSDDNLWIILNNRGITKYDGKIWTTYNTSNSGIPSDFVRFVAIDKNRIKWICTSAGFSMFEDTSWTSVNIPDSDPVYNVFSSLCFDQQGNKWVSAYNQKTGSWFGKFNNTNLTRFNTSNSSVSRDDFISIGIDQQNIKWIGAEYGSLLKFDDKDWTVINDTNSIRRSGPVNSILIDRNGNRWFATGNGLVKYDGNDWSIINNAEPGTTGNIITCIAEDSSGNLWYGADGDGVVKFDGYNKTVFDLQSAGITSDFMKSIAIDHEGNIWAASHIGLAKYDGDAWTAQDYKVSFPINCILVDSHDTKWFGTNGRGLIKYDNQTWTVCDSPYIGSTITSLAMDSQGSLWIGSDFRGITKYDGHTWTFYNYLNSGLPNNDVQSLAVDRYDNIWIGSPGCVTVFREKGLILEIEKYTAEIAREYILKQNFPNPFNPVTTISYSIPKQSYVELKIYDIIGREIAALVSKEQSAGEYSVQFNGSFLPSGIYIYSIQAGGYRDSKKLVLLK